MSRNDGSHEFARTLEEHNRNVQKYQVQYFREELRKAEVDGGVESTEMPAQPETFSAPPHLSFCRSTSK